MHLRTHKHGRQILRFCNEFSYTLYSSQQAIENIENTSEVDLMFKEGILWQSGWVSLSLSQIMLGSTGESFAQSKWRPKIKCLFETKNQWITITIYADVC